MNQLDCYLSDVSKAALFDWARSLLPPGGAFSLRELERGLKLHFSNDVHYHFSIWEYPNHHALNFEVRIKGELIEKLPSFKSNVEFGEHLVDTLGGVAYVESGSWDEFIRVSASKLERVPDPSPDPLKYMERRELIRLRQTKA